VIQTTSNRQKLIKIPSNRRAIVVLTRGYDSLDGYNELILRTNAIKYHKWSQNYDHIIFHEGNITPLHQKYICSKTKPLPLQFVSVKKSFDRNMGRAEQTGELDELCPWYGKNNLGYKSMCAFWFTDFIEYTSEYDAILRIDEDCIIDKNSANDPAPDKNTALASAMYQGMDNPEVIVGMRKFATSVSMQLGVKAPKDLEWVSPYTNVMWVSMQYAKSHNVREIVKLVHETNCIMRNRWGDLPLWGLTMSLLGTPQVLLDIKYYHGSHNVFVK